MILKKLVKDCAFTMDNGHLDPPLSYYQLRKRAATWLRCGTLSSLILTLAGVAMIILGIQGTPASYNIKWIGIAASASGGSLLLLLLLISLIMASFCPQEGSGSLQMQLQQGLPIPPPCPPSHHHLHAHQHAIPSGSGALTPTSRHPGRASMDSMQWMVYYHPSKHQQLEHSILYPIPGFPHGMNPPVGGSAGLHNGAQWAWRAHHATIQPPPQYSSLYPDPNGGSTPTATTTNTENTGNSTQEATSSTNAGETNAGTTTSVATTTTPTEQCVLQRPRRLTPPPLASCSGSSDRHVHHHHHHSIRPLSGHGSSPQDHHHSFRPLSGHGSSPQDHHHSIRPLSGHGSSPQGQLIRTPTPGHSHAGSISPGQISHYSDDPNLPPDHHQQQKTPVEALFHHHHHHHRDHQTPSPSSQQVHLFHHQHPVHLPLKQSPIAGPSHHQPSSSSSRRSYHSSLPSSPLLDHVDETQETSDCV